MRLDITKQVHSENFIIIKKQGHNLIFILGHLTCILRFQVLRHAPN